MSKKKKTEENPVEENLNLNDKEEKVNIRNSGRSHQNLTAKNKIKMLEALEKNKGIVTYACKAAHIIPNTYYKYYKEDPEFRAAADAIQETVCDFVEKKLYDNIDRGDTKSIMFYLRCKGQKRGFVDKSEQTINFNDISIDLNLD